ncbi:MAG: hypothetical protein P8Q54_11925 [Akkermansiaceae bacterium]|nr:hypothetical protein [Akkermansiaceae bacterium]
MPIILPPINRRQFNPLSPPCIPPKFVLHGLSSKSKFLAVVANHILLTTTEKGGMSIDSIEVR